MKKILLIGTGGTISSVPSPNGLEPQIPADRLIEAVPEIHQFCDVECLQLLNVDSTNILPKHWLMIASVIEKNYNDYDGFVILHGTDTMAYSAAALCYLIQNNRKPIVLTGSQMPLISENSDAARNLTDAFICACDENSCGTQIVFSGSVILGTRARKNYSKSFFAFGSINFPEIACIQSNRLIRYIKCVSDEDLRFYHEMNSNVGLLKLVPGIGKDVLQFIINRYDGLVVESFGVGGLPEYTDIFSQLKEATDKGKLIVMTTQVPNEGSDLSVYQVGKSLKDQLQVLEAHDMTTEAAFAKLMWVLGQTNQFDKAAELFYKPVLNDILFS